MILPYIHLLFQSNGLLLTLQTVALCIKMYLFLFLIYKAYKSAGIQKQLIFLLIIISGSSLGDLAWIMGLLSTPWLDFLDFRLALFTIRFAWAFNCILFLALGFFIESIYEKKYVLKLRQKLLILFICPWIGYFLSRAFFYFNITDIANRSFESFAMQIGSLILPLIFVLPSICLTIIKMQSYTFPNILRKQLTILIRYFFTPYLVTQFVEWLLIVYRELFLLHALTNIFFTSMLWYSIAKILKLRFLNFSPKIQSPQRIEFIDNFKTLLIKLSQIKNINELNHVIQTFFKDALNVNHHRVTLYIRNSELSAQSALSSEEAFVERLINNPKQGPLLEFLLKQRILLYDEIEFSEFYENNSLHREILAFLDAIHAEVFLPIYEHNILTAYIIIGATPRQSKNSFFSELDHDKMIVLGNYLGNNIALLQNSNYHQMLEENKVLNDELYHKHQEIRQYKESIQSFIRDNKQRQTGVLFYKNYTFTFGNQAARDLIPININFLEGHPITKALKKLAKQTEEYKAAQIDSVMDQQGNTLILSALPHLEKNNIIITVSYTEISDVIKQQINQLPNPSDWDYLLYLKTTDVGKAINRLIPSNGKQLLNFKIELLKVALTKKAILLNLPEEDLQPTVDILHYVSMRENIYNLSINSFEKNGMIALKLFGMNSIFGIFEQALLEQLNTLGTLFIQNVHLLGLSTQDALAEFIKYGYYRAIKSDKKTFADVRIICSSIHNLQSLVQEGKFSKSLFEQLSTTTITMPSLFDLTSDELNDLAQGLTQQTITNSSQLQKFLEFNQRDKDQLIKVRSLSLAGFRKKIQQILIEKTKKHELSETVIFDPACTISDPEIADAARLGKNALRDPKKLLMLMQKFDHNQNRVAAFLGVNRSSINRRLKSYKIEAYDDNDDELNNAEPKNKQPLA